MGSNQGEAATLTRMENGNDTDTFAGTSTTYNMCTLRTHYWRPLPATHAGRYASTTLVRQRVRFSPREASLVVKIEPPIIIS